MRPLNARETSNPSNARVWKILPSYNSITQTTPAGLPLKEKAKGRSFFQYDKAFGEETTNTAVYDACGRPLVKSILRGVNSTMFAYGQTSSGKTYTMSGDGATPPEGGQEGQGGSEGQEGVLQMSVRDLFREIDTDADNREFLVRVSYIEIYNEEIRDLLVTAAPEKKEVARAFGAGKQQQKDAGSSNGGGAIVSVREDPKKGVYVEAEER